ncbi:MAG TPA: universal stress protein [Actinomycetales bacterium]|nr:universal stress protein [Actinomycetales bacterium]
MSSQGETTKLPGEENEGFDPPITGGIVVGHDGSTRSSVALAWAADEARLRGLPLHVVRAWKLSTAIPETNVPFGTVPSWDECALAIKAAIDRALEGVDTGGLTVHRHALHGSPSTLLVEASQDADMVVVGERGQGGFAGLVIGSVAEQVVRHAKSTVVVVREDAD